MEDRHDSDSAATYTNAHGTTYFLCSVTTKTGKQRLVASRTPVGTPLSAIPEGFEFAENVNGQVSVRKVRAQTIKQEELTAVREALGAAPGCEPYRVDVDRDAIVIYQPSMFPAEMEELAGRLTYGESMLDRLRGFAENNATYSHSYGSF